MVFILEEAQKGTLTPQSAAEAAKAALMLLGNASAQMVKERRKNVTKDLNKDLMQGRIQDFQKGGHTLIERAIIATTLARKVIMYVRAPQVVVIRAAPCRE